jgi:hypothetical protein
MMKYSSGNSNLLYVWSTSKTRDIRMGTHRSLAILTRAIDQRKRMIEWHGLVSTNVPKIKGGEGGDETRLHPHSTSLTTSIFLQCEVCKCKKESVHTNHSSQTGYLQECRINS